MLSRVERPDDDTRVCWDRRTLHHMQKALETMPVCRNLDWDFQTLDVMIEGFATGSRRASACGGKRSGPAEIVLEEVAAEFDGEDAIKPVCRDDLARTKGTLEALQRNLVSLDAAAELSEPEGDELLSIRSFLA